MMDVWTDPDRRSLPRTRLGEGFAYGVLATLGVQAAAVALLTLVLR